MTIGDYISPRSRPGPSRTRIERRLAAILGADIAGYSALMERDEESTHQKVGAELECFNHEIKKSSGRVFSFAGDGLMAEFPSSVEALRCSLRMQADAERRNAARSAPDAIRFRIGLNSGELVIQNGRTGGTATNTAARLEQIAQPGLICFSAAVF